MLSLWTRKRISESSSLRFSRRSSRRSSSFPRVILDSLAWRRNHTRTLALARSDCRKPRSGLSQSRLGPSRADLLVTISTVSPVFNCVFNATNRPLTFPPVHLCPNSV